MNMAILIVLAVLLVLAAAALFILCILLKRLSPEDSARVEQAVREELRQGREESSREAKALREEVSQAQEKSNQTLVQTLKTLGDSQNTRLDGVTKAMDRFNDTTRQENERLRDKLAQLFKDIQASNEQKLDQMRQTVDEKLQSTLEKRIGDSFKLVSDRLEAVQRGLGEMQTLASGVGDLKRVLTNVRARGTWGEVQLEAILEQILTPEQYAKNVVIQEGSRENVEFAVRLPGKDEDGPPVWLPIDAKFPREDYERLLDAEQAANTEGIKQSREALAKQVEACAGTIQKKYIHPPASTDFAILFLPTEGLYAEVLRHPGLPEKLQQQYRVIPTGPTTLAAILNSLRVGFKTLAIEKRSSEVWRVLAAVKTEFGKFGGILEKIKKQVSTVSNTLEETSTRTRAMARQLRSVEELPSSEAQTLLELTDITAEIDVELEESV